MIARRSAAAATGFGAALLLTLTACSSAGDITAADPSNTAGPQPTMSQSAPEPMTKTDSRKQEPNQAATVPGSFINYADYQSDPKKYGAGDVVLFFNATWCPTCQEATGNLESAAIPEGLTVVSVDYDSNSDLRQQYGITTQHTFVQVDADGNQLTKFTGSTTAEEINGQLL